jgi:hypothetical protein
MDELRILLMPPRSSGLLLGAATSSSILCWDSEVECLREELDGASDNDDHVFLPSMLFIDFLIVPCCINSQTTLLGVSCQSNMHKEKYMEGQEL